MSFENRLNQPGDYSKLRRVAAVTFGALALSVGGLSCSSKTESAKPAPQITTTSESSSTTSSSVEPQVTTTIKETESENSNFNLLPEKNYMEFDGGEIDAKKVVNNYFSMLRAYIITGDEDYIRVSLGPDVDTSGWVEERANIVERAGTDSNGHINPNDYDYVGDFSQAEVYSSGSLSVQLNGVLAKETVLGKTKYFDRDFTIGVEDVYTDEGEIQAIIISHVAGSQPDHRSDN